MEDRAQLTNGNVIMANALIRALCATVAMTALTIPMRLMTTAGLVRQ